MKSIPLLNYVNWIDNCTYGLPWSDSINEWVTTSCEFLLSNSQLKAVAPFVESIHFIFYLHVLLLTSTLYAALNYFWNLCGWIWPYSFIITWLLTWGAFLALRLLSTVYCSHQHGHVSLLLLDIGQVPEITISLLNNKN